jgi:hypothetical protein
MAEIRVTGQNFRAHRKTRPTDISSATDFTLSCLILNPGLAVDKSASNRLILGIAVSKIEYFVFIFAS